MTFTVISDAQIRVTVPTGARTGKVRFVSAGGQATSMGKFTVR